MQKRIYIISQDGLADRLVEAVSLAKAKAYAASNITGKLASQRELVELTVAGVPVESEGDAQPVNEANEADASDIEPNFQEA